MKLKTFSILFFLVLTHSISAHGEFIFSKEGINTLSIVKLSDSLSQEDLYRKTVNYIKETYNNPEEVIKAKFENKKIRYTGVKSNALSYKSIGLVNYNDVKYTIEVSFKEGRYKFEVVNIQQYLETTKYSSGGWQEFDLESGERFYKKNGKIRKIFSNTISEINTLLNELINGLDDYISKSKGVEDDW